MYEIYDVFAPLHIFVKMEIFGPSFSFCCPGISLVLAHGHVREKVSLEKAYCCVLKGQKNTGAGVREELVVGDHCARERAIIKEGSTSVRGDVECTKRSGPWK